MTSRTAAPPVLAYRVANRSWVWAIGLTILGAALTALFAQFTVPMWPVPITGQTFAVLVVGAGLGSRLGASSQILYLAAAAAGAPIFADGASGAEHFVGPTVGYLVAFPIAAALVGWLAEKKLDRTVRSAVGVFLLGSVLIIAIGVLGLMATLEYPLGEAVADGALPFIPGEAIKAALAAVVLPTAWKLGSSGAGS